MKTLYNRTLANRYTKATFRTLTKHWQGGKFNRNRALKLLRNNVRDVQPNATGATQQTVATQLLQHWFEYAIKD